MRGKLSCINYPYTRPRITPADAGKTSSIKSYLFLKRDHPRRCGENRYKTISSAQKVGSPPQMRGKPADESAVAMCLRITPADAGKTLPHSCVLSLG